MQATYKQTAIKAAKEAGKILIRYYGKPIKVYVKEENNLFSTADLEAEKKVISIIKSKYPEHSILSEECGTKKGNSYRWLIDPLDGTHNYLHGLPLFGVSIALEKDKEVILGVIYLPCYNRLYVAEKGKGAFLNNKRIKVSNTNKLKKAMMLYDGGLRRGKKAKLKALDKLVDSVFRIRILGAACFNLTSLANGDADIYMEHSTNPWDVAAGLLIIEEAGGKVTTLDGKKHDISEKGFVASNGKLHNNIITITKKF
ncbi:inositol monophosphatase [Candidatus Woesearchaeota archaeon]|nr:inositol monophosphatase [Candidatus Woesearchaeota archaeon]